MCIKVIIVAEILSWSDVVNVQVMLLGMQFSVVIGL